MIEFPLSLQIFEMRDTDVAGYQLTLPGVMISGVDLPLDFQDGQWGVSQTENGVTWSAIHEYKNAALLKLIARRMGYDAQLTPVASTQEER